MSNLFKQTLESFQKGYKKGLNDYKIPASSSPGLQKTVANLEKSYQSQSDQITFGSEKISTLEKPNEILNLNSENGEILSSEKITGLTSYQDLVVNGSKKVLTDISALIAKDEASKEEKKDGGFLANATNFLKNSPKMVNFFLKNASGGIARNLREAKRDLNQGLFLTGTQELLFGNQQINQRTGDKNRMNIDNLYTISSNFIKEEINKMIPNWSTLQPQTQEAILDVLRNYKYNWLNYDKSIKELPIEQRNNYKPDYYATSLKRNEIKTNLESIAFNTAILGTGLASLGVAGLSLAATKASVSSVRRIGASEKTKLEEVYREEFDQKVGKSLKENFLRSYQNNNLENFDINLELQNSNPDIGKILRYVEQNNIPLSPELRQVVMQSSASWVARLAENELTGESSFALQKLNEILTSPFGSIKYDENTDELGKQIAEKIGKFVEKIDDSYQKTTNYIETDIEKAKQTKNIFGFREATNLEKKAGMTLKSRLTKFAISVGMSAVSYGAGSILRQSVAEVLDDIKDVFSSTKTNIPVDVDGNATIDGYLVSAHTTSGIEAMQNGNGTEIGEMILVSNTAQPIEINEQILNEVDKAMLEYAKDLNIGIDNKINSLFDENSGIYSIKADNSSDSQLNFGGKWYNPFDNKSFEVGSSGRTLEIDLDGDGKMEVVSVVGTDNNDNLIVATSNANPVAIDQLQQKISSGEWKGFSDNKDKSPFLINQTEIDQDRTINFDEKDATLTNIEDKIAAINTNKDQFSNADEQLLALNNLKNQVSELQEGQKIVLGSESDNLIFGSKIFETTGPEIKIDPNNGVTIANKTYSFADLTDQNKGKLSQEDLEGIREVFKNNEIEFSEKQQVEKLLEAIKIIDGNDNHTKDLQAILDNLNEGDSIDTTNMTAGKYIITDKIDLTTQPQTTTPNKNSSTNQSQSSQSNQTNQQSQQNNQNSNSQSQQSQTQNTPNSNTQNIPTSGGISPFYKIGYSKINGKPVMSNLGQINGSNYEVGIKRMFVGQIQNPNLQTTFLSALQDQNSTQSVILNNYFNKFNNGITNMVNQGYLGVFNNDQFISIKLSDNQTIFDYLKANSGLTLGDLKVNPSVDPTTLENSWKTNMVDGMQDSFDQLNKIAPNFDSSSSTIQIKHWQMDFEKDANDQMTISRIPVNPQASNATTSNSSLIAQNQSNSDVAGGNSNVPPAVGGKEPLNVPPNAQTPPLSNQSSPSSSVSETGEGSNIVINGDGNEVHINLGGNSEDSSNLEQNQQLNLEDKFTIKSSDITDDVYEDFNSDGVLDSIFSGEPNNRLLDSSGKIATSDQTFTSSDGNYQIVMQKDGVFRLSTLNNHTPQAGEKVVFENLPIAEVDTNDEIIKQGTNRIEIEIADQNHIWDVNAKNQTENTPLKTQENILERGYNDINTIDGKLSGLENEVKYREGLPWVFGKDKSVDLSNLDSKTLKVEINDILNDQEFTKTELGQYLVELNKNTLSSLNDDQKEKVLGNAIDLIKSLKSIEGDNSLTDAIKETQIENAINQYFTGVSSILNTSTSSNAGDIPWGGLLLVGGLVAGSLPYFAHPEAETGMRGHSILRLDGGANQNNIRFSVNNNTNQLFRYNSPIDREYIGNIISEQEAIVDNNNRTNFYLKNDQIHFANIPGIVVGTLNTTNQIVDPTGTVIGDYDVATGNLNITADNTVATFDLATNQILVGGNVVAIFNPTTNNIEVGGNPVATVNGVDIQVTNTQLLGNLNVDQDYRRQVVRDSNTDLVIHTISRDHTNLYKEGNGHRIASQRNVRPAFIGGNFMADGVFGTTQKTNNIANAILTSLLVGAGALTGGGLAAGAALGGSALGNVITRLMNKGRIPIPFTKGIPLNKIPGIGNRNNIG